MASHKRKRPDPDAEYIPVSMAEQRAYIRLAEIYRKWNRMPFAHDSWPIVRNLPRFARYEGMTPAGKPKTATHASRRQVECYVRSLFKRVMEAAEFYPYVQAVTRELARGAQETIRECLKKGGEYDAKPALLNAKSKVALKILELGGLSQETAAKPAEVTVNIGGAIPEDEHETTRENRLAKYQETTGIDPRDLSFTESEN